MEPHLTITQSVSFRKISGQWAHIAAEIDLKNDSRVEVRVRKATYYLFLVARYENRHARALSKRLNDDDGKTRYINWEVISQIDGPVGAARLVIEPGESHQEMVEFIFEHSAYRPLKTVLISSLFYNEKDAKHWWQARTVYEIKGKSEDGTGPGQEQEEASDKPDGTGPGQEQEEASDKPDPP